MRRDGSVANNRLLAHSRSNVNRTWSDMLHCAVMKKQQLLFIVSMLVSLPCLGQLQHSALQSAALPLTEGFGVDAAQRFAKLALACVHKEYPNKLAHSLN